MTKPTESKVHRTEMYQPEEVQEMFGLKKGAYYNRLKFLEIQAHKDEQGKAYLDDYQLDLLKELDEYISINGKMTGFSYNKNSDSVGSLVTTDENGLTTSPNNSTALDHQDTTEEADIYVEPQEPVENSEVAVLIREAEELKARELAMRDLIKRKLADEMNEEDLSPDLQQKVNLAREAANPKFTPQQVAGTLLTQWRKNRLAS
ncbi:MAG: hypothetical protein AB4041_20245 [Microcystaceae cyanobacterium]